MHSDDPRSDIRGRKKRSSRRKPRVISLSLPLSLSVSNHTPSGNAGYKKATEGLYELHKPPTDLPHECAQALTKNSRSNHTTFKRYLTPPNNKKEIPSQTRSLPTKPRLDPNASQIQTPAITPPLAVPLKRSSHTSPLTSPKHTHITSTAMSARLLHSWSATSSTLPKCDSLQIRTDSALQRAREVHLLQRSRVGWEDETCGEGGEEG